MIFMISVLAAIAAAAAPTPLIDKYECARCHDLEGAAPLPLTKRCVACHRAIIDGTYPNTSGTQLSMWRDRLHSLRTAPSLDGVAQRFRRSWVRGFLRAPYDLRPGLLATMPRFEMSEADADAIAKELGATDDDTPHPSYDSATVARGRELAKALQCVECHQLDDAPDLRTARERLRPRLVRSIVRDPRATMPSAKMPSFELSAPDALALEAWLIGGEAPPRPNIGIPSQLPPLDRRVGFAEVFERVFKRTCWHCHSDPELAKGDGGPGNTGGFGFAPRGLSFASYQSISEGSFGDDGERRSIAPLLLQSLRARQIEEAGGVVPSVRGMPLGLPALSPEQIQLVQTWLAQGRPR